jgi:hypothetical protein
MLVSAYERVSQKCLHTSIALVAAVRAFGVAVVTDGVYVRGVLRYIRCAGIHYSMVVPNYITASKCVPGMNTIATGTLDS